MLALGVVVPVCRAQVPVAPFPSFHIDADLGRLYNQRSEFSKRRYFVESRVNIDVSFLSLYNMVDIGSSFFIHSGMGQTLDNVVFDPMDASYGFDPYIGITFAPLRVRTGVEHHCYHEIDRRDFTTVYYNKLFVSLASPRFHPLRLIHDAAQGLSPPSLEHLGWDVRYGIFLRSFFGLVRPSSVSYHNNYRHEASADLRYVLARNGPLFLSLFTTATLGYWDDYLDKNMDEPGWYRSLTVALEPGMIGGRSGVVGVLSYTRDALPLFYSRTSTAFHPRFSRNRLWKIALRLFV